MTTKTATKSTKSGPQPWPIALALAVLMIVVTVVLLFLQMQPATTSIPYRSGQKIDVRYNRHAVEQHGNQALAVRRACENGPEQVWKTRSIENYSFLCQLEGGT